MTVELKEPYGRQVSAFIPSFLMSKIIGSLNSMKGFEKAPVASGYEAVRGRVGDKTVILYYSGSIVYDESLEEVKNTIEEALYEYYRKEGIVIGSDEAGKGEALGPLTVAAVALNPRQAAHLQSIGVMDSKLIPRYRIPKLASRIKKVSLAHSVLRITPIRFNKMFMMKEKYGNLNEILAHAHSKVLRKTLSRLTEKPSRIVIDKFDSSKGEKSMSIIREVVKDLRIDMIAGGEVIPAVAAASVLARNSYLTWIRRNLDEDTLRSINGGNYDALGGQDRLKHYVKIRYLKFSKEM